MELFQELIVTVAISLLVSFVIAKLFSISTTCDANNSASVMATVAEESVFRDEKSVFETERSVLFVDEALEFTGLGKEEESRAETIGSPVAYEENDDVVDIEVFPEAVGAGGLAKRISGKSVVIDEERLVGVGGVEFEHQLFEEGSEREKLREIGIESASFREIEIESGKEGVNMGESDGVRVLESGDKKGSESDGVERSENECEEEEGGFGDWEGVERTELEKRFGDAVVFVGSKSNADRISRLDTDTKLGLFGLHKVAIEGPCSVPSPMALKVSARAKWNAWQQLGDMSREVAMEKYISLLSRSIPGWMGDDSKDSEQVLSDVGSATILPFNLRDHGIENDSGSEELKPCEKDRGMIGSIQSP